MTRQCKIKKKFLMATQKFTSNDKVFFLKYTLIRQPSQTQKKKISRRGYSSLYSSHIYPSTNLSSQVNTGRMQPPPHKQPLPLLDSGHALTANSHSPRAHPGPATGCHLSLTGAQTLNRWWLCPLLCVRDFIMQWERTWPLCLDFSELPYLPFPTPSSKDLLFPFI